MPNPTTKACQHKPTPDMGYNAAHADADERLKRGERQGVCPFCCKWIWSYLFFTRTDFIEALETAEQREGAILRQSRRDKRRKR